jgi:hypothetical protein
MKGSTSSRSRCRLLLGALAAFAALLVVPAPAGASPYPLSFAEAETYVLGSSPESAAVGDVTGDGLADVLVSTERQTNPHPNDNKVFLYRQLSDGTLAPPEAFSPAQDIGIPSIDVGDIDGDGLLDVVAATYAGVDVFLQRDGTLSEPIVVQGSTGARQVVVADVDRDGRNDLVIRADAMLLAHNVDGLTFTVSMIGAEYPYELDVGDVTGDGRPDVVTLYYQQHRLHVWSQLLDGTFAPPVSYAVPGGSFGGLALGDLDTDGRLDAAVAVSGSNAGVYQLLQTPAGVLAAPVRMPVYQSVSSTDAFDLSGDGRDDLVTLHDSEPTAGVLVQTRRGYLHGPDYFRAPSWAFNYTDSIGLGDFSGDGLADIAVPGPQGYLIVLRQQRRRSPPKPPPPLPPAPPQPPPLPPPGPPPRLAFAPAQAYWVGNADPESAAIGDVTGDGRNDALLGTLEYNDWPNSYKLFHFRQEVGNALATPLRLGTEGAGGGRFIEIGDLDGDGVSDAAINTGYGIDVYRHLAGGIEIEPLLIPGTCCSGVIQIADFDRDGHNDLLFSGGPPAGIYLAHNDGDMRFTISFVLAASELFQLADVTGDGLEDLTTLAGRQLSVYRRLAGGGFSGPTVYLTTEYPNAGFAVGDVTGDGRNDVVVTVGGNVPNAALNVFVQNSGGGLDAAVSYPSEQAPEAVRVMDMNRDGRTDVVVTHEGNAGVYLQGVGGTLMSEAHYGGMYASHLGQQSLALGDLTGDGLPDIAIANYNSGLVVLRQLRPYSPPRPPRRLALAPRRR